MAKIVGTFGGLDPSGGAGVIADVKTISQLGCYPVTALSTIVPQNTVRVYGSYNVSYDQFEQQLESIYDDVAPHAVKTGALASYIHVKMIADRVGDIPLVLDPVLVASTGSQIVSDDTLAAIKAFLIPKATIITPNIQEASFLLNRTINTIDEQRDAAYELLSLGCDYVLLKGGHGHSDIIQDVLVGQGIGVAFEHPRIRTKNTHGTGCTLSAAIACNLAKEMDVCSAVELAIDFVCNCINRSNETKIGQGIGPVLQYELQ